MVFDDNLSMLVDFGKRIVSRVSGEIFKEAQREGLRSRDGQTVAHETGVIKLSRFGWDKRLEPLKDDVVPPLACTYEFRSHANGDVESVDIKVVNGMGVEVFTTSCVDPTDLGSGGRRAVCLSGDATRFCSIELSRYDHSWNQTAVVNGTVLKGFDGGGFVRGPDAIDRRTACFSQSGNLILIEDRNFVYGIWDCESGDQVWSFDLIPIRHSVLFGV
jgi:hypothetical protein